MALSKLTAAKIKNAKAGMHGDGGGLWLQVQGGGQKSWCFRFTSPETSKVRQMGLGGLDTVGLPEARERAAECRRLLGAGRDPISERETTKKAEATVKAEVVTFQRAGDAYISSHSAGWRNPKHRQQWQNTLATYAYPRIGTKPVADISSDDVLSVLNPIWSAAPETAARVRGRIEAILDFAGVHGWRAQGFNPATWRGNLAKALPSKAKIAPVQHHAALDWREMPSFMGRLAVRDGMGVLALRFAILTAARSGEVRGMRWSELDPSARIWTVPAERMKSKRLHRVPLSDAAMAILRDPAMPAKPAEGDALVFQGMKAGVPLSDMTLTAVLRRMGRGDLTGHGFRSSFRDWCAEATNHPREVAEMALAHAIDSKVEAAYRRGDLFEKRRSLMDAWATFCHDNGITDRNQKA
jgi:integrase